jgi:hypothetical protein
MFKKGIKKDYFNQVKGQYKNNYTYTIGLNFNTLTYITPNFKVIYNGGEKVLVKCKLGNYKFIANVRQFMKKKWKEVNED